MRTLIAVLAGVSLAGGAVRPPLVDASRNSDKEAVRALLAKKADVNAADGDGSTALLWASYRDDVETADLLLRAGAKVNVATDLGVTPLWAASQNGSAPMVKRLLAAGANPNAALLAGETPLMLAARSGYPEVVELLLSGGAKHDARGTRGQTALMWAAAQSHPDVVKVLLAHGADVNARSDAWNEMMAVSPHGYPDYNKLIPHGSDTPLLFAVRSGDLASLKQLVAAGANVNDADAWGVSATVLAEHAGFSGMVAFLLDKDADPNAAKAGFTALHEAILRRDEKTVAVLLAHGANANTPLKTWTPTRRSSHDFHFEPALVGATPFWLAARFAEPGVMRLLLQHGADPKFVHRSETIAGENFRHRSETTTALLAAVGMGGGGTAWVPPTREERDVQILEAVKLAVESGVEVNAVNTDGRTAFDAAKTLRNDAVVQYLTANGAKAGKPVRQAPGPE